MTEGTRAVVFDLDNTLILEDASTHAALRAAGEVAHLSAGVDPDLLATAAADAAAHFWKVGPPYAFAERFGIWWGEALWGDFAGDAGELPAIRAYLPQFRERVWREALERAGHPDERLAHELQRRYADARRAGETIDPEAEPVLRDLHGDHRLALLTNGAGDVQREKLARTPLAGYFAEIVISVEVGVGKPDPRLFEIALGRLGVAASDAVMVGDSRLRDVAGAQRAGMRAVWIDRGASWEGDGPAPDATIRRLSDLRAALDALERRTASPRATT